MNLDKAIYSRKSVKKFSGKKPDWRDIIECLDATRMAPMSGNNFTLKFIIVDDPKKIQKLADAAQQNFVASAHYVVVVCTNPLRTKNAFGERAEIYLRQQAGAAIQNFLLKLEERKLATCWVGHFIEKNVKDPLKIPAGVNVEALLPIGYEEGKTQKKSKIDLKNVLYFNEYNEGRMKPFKKIEV